MNGKKPENNGYWRIHQITKDSGTAWWEGDTSQQIPYKSTTISLEAEIHLEEPTYQTLTPSVGNTTEKKALEAYKIIENQDLVYDVITIDFR